MYRIRQSFLFMQELKIKMRGQTEIQDTKSVNTNKKYF